MPLCLEGSVPRSRPLPPVRAMPEIFRWRQLLIGALVLAPGHRAGLAALRAPYQRLAGWGVGVSPTERGPPLDRKSARSDSFVEMWACRRRWVLDHVKTAELPQSSVP